MRAIPILSLLGLLAVTGCGEVDVEKAASNAALAALEASNPEVIQGIRAAQVLRQAAATCGWQDVDAAGLARSAVSGIEEAPLRAAASSLVEDLIVSDASPAQNAGAVTPSQCSPEARQALQTQIAAMSQSESEAEAEGG